VAPARPSVDVGVSDRGSGYGWVMTDPRLEDHAFGVELQMTELVEKIERASIQGRPDRVAELQGELEALQDDLVSTAESIASEHFDHAEIHPRDVS
jgi:hypothetical protein